MSSAQRYFIDPSETLSIAINAAGLRHYPANWGLGPKPMGCNFIQLFVRGQGWIECAGNRVDAQEGDLFIFKHGHTYFAEGDPRVATTVYNALFMIRGIGGRDILRPMALPFRMRLNLDERRQLESAFWRFTLEHQGFREPSLMRRLAARGALLLLLSEVLRLCATVPAAARTEGPPPLPEMNSGLAAVLEHIDKSLDRPLTVAKLAELAHLSPSHFSALFRKTIGKPPMDYLRQQRVAAAREKLLHTDKSVKQIAGEVGYPDSFLFSRVFKKATGVAPNIFRESYKNPLSR